VPEQLFCSAVIYDDYVFIG